MYVAKRKIDARVALGCLTIAGVVASSAVVLNRAPYENFRFAEVIATNDGAMYAMAVRYPLVREPLLKTLGIGDMASLSARLERDRHALRDARERMNRRMLIDCMTLGGSLAVFFMAGLSLLKR